MLGPQAKALFSQIMKALPHHDDVDAAAAAVRSELDDLLPGATEALGEEFDRAVEAVRKQFERVEIHHSYSIISKRKQWYWGTQPGDIHWPALRGFLLEHRKWAREDVNAIDKAATEVVSLLENPNDERRTQFQGRGLVVGHVQSGKTANMTAVMAKALDAGYNTVIVLAGMTNKLRHQTQKRMLKDLVQRNPLRWQVLTPSTETEDFRAPPHGGFLSHVDKSQLAVVKKNKSPLDELIQAISDTLPAVLSRLRVLVIDDECDQASVNAARGELDMTAINQRIRTVLSMLPAVTYVGYTATPFANVLINPYKVEGQELDDLYPRDFITALPTSERYFGTARLFGRTPTDPEYPQAEDEGLDMIRDVPPEDEALLTPARASDRDDFVPVMTRSLEDAILYYLAACAARLVRGHDDQHMTMLVHTSTYISTHERLAHLIEHWVRQHCGAIVAEGGDVVSRMKSLWVSEARRVPGDLTEAEPVSFETLRTRLPDVLERIEFPIENGASDDRINYTEEQPRIYIVVGGSILARGLTLEGLTVSYFLRSANQFDTLLQMGRWFGYRPGYEDLPRIWMPPDLKLRFRELAEIEHEIRADIAEYKRADLTPMELAVRIRTVPGMAITATAKMRHARRCSVSYWGTHRQTFRFLHKDLQVQKENWNAGVQLIDAANSVGQRQVGDDGEPMLLWVDVPRSAVVQFLSAYRPHGTHRDLQPEFLIPFVSTNDRRLDRWNVGIVTSKRGETSADPLGPIGKVRTVRRSRLRDLGEVADIKALMSKGDLLFDVEEKPGEANLNWDELKNHRRENRGEIPLLLLYPIDRESRPEREGLARVALDAVHDVLGYGVVFPGTVAEGGDYVSVELDFLSAEDLAAIEAEERSQVEVAGVNSGS